MNLNTRSLIDADLSSYKILELETEIDGVQVKAVAFRNFKTHRIEIYEPFEHGKIGADISLIGVPHYQKWLKGRDLYQDSLKLVHEAYKEYLKNKQ